MFTPARQREVLKNEKAAMAKGKRNAAKKVKKVVAVVKKVKKAVAAVKPPAKKVTPKTPKKKLVAMVNKERTQLKKVKAEVKKLSAAKPAVAIGVKNLANLMAKYASKPKSAKKPAAKKKSSAAKKRPAAAKKPAGKKRVNHRVAMYPRVIGGVKVKGHRLTEHGDYLLAISKTPIIGNKLHVWNGTARKTPGGLTISHLILAPSGKVASIKQFLNGKKAYARNKSKMAKPFKKGHKRIAKKKGGFGDVDVGGADYMDQQQEYQPSYVGGAGQYYYDPSHQQQQQQPQYYDQGMYSSPALVGGADQQYAEYGGYAY